MKQRATAASPQLSPLGHQPAPRRGPIRPRHSACCALAGKSPADERPIIVVVGLWLMSVVRKGVVGCQYSPFCMARLGEMPNPRCCWGHTASTRRLLEPSRATGFARVRSTISGPTQVINDRAVWTALRILIGRPEPLSQPQFSGCITSGPTDEHRGILTAKSDVRQLIQHAQSCGWVGAGPALSGFDEELREWVGDSHRCTPSDCA